MTTPLRNDTICAVSTPAGVGGIAVVRLSGPRAQEGVLPFLRSGSVAALGTRVVALSPRRATFVSFVVDGKLLDEVVVTFFAAPHSYTGEDVVEVACHGSLYVQQMMLQTLVNAGLRLAEAGEFTRRAFLNGRMDLSQAEAVADLIDSTNVTSHQLAISQLRGGYSKELTLLRERFVELASLLELELDFSDEEVEFADRCQLRRLTSELQSKVAALCSSFALGNAIKQGVPVAIVGRPNVGKSTLLNALLHEDRAIVSDIPGTTRDTVEDNITLDGIGFRFVDTAGLRNSDDIIEKEGMQRSIHAAEQAQIVLYVVDASQSIEAARQEIAQLCHRARMDGKHLLLLRNKADLCAEQESPRKAQDSCAGVEEYVISAKSGWGIEALAEKLVQLVREQMPQNATLVSNLRHYEALKRIGDSLVHVRKGLDQQLPADLVVIDLREALYYLGQITGQVTSDEVLGAIFSRFCVGK